MKTEDFELIRSKLLTNNLSNRLDKDQKKILIELLPSVFDWEEIMYLQQYLLFTHHSQMITENKSLTHELQDMAMSYKPDKPSSQILMPGDMIWIRYRHLTNKKEVCNYLDNFEAQAFSISWIKTFYPWLEEIILNLGRNHLIDYDK